MTQADILTVLNNHEKWLRGEDGSVRANMRRANLRGANLRGANMSEADLRGADLRRANMRGADLRGADMSGADLSEADMSEADMSGADLRRADLRGVNMRGADLRGVKISWTVGNMTEIKSMCIDTYVVSWVGDVLAIGCQQHTVAEWKSYTDAEIDEMDAKAIKFWKKWQDMIFRLMEFSKEVE